MNILLKICANILKILTLLLITFVVTAQLFTGGIGHLIVGLWVLILIGLPTVFVFYFKNKFLEKHPNFKTWWKVILIIYIIATVLFVLGTISAFWRGFQRDWTQQAISAINSKSINLDDVLGKNLPPVPEPTINDLTVEGIDANNNYIRDDVELAIFQKYPDSAKIRAAELQYAQALQLELTQVFNSETLVAVMQKKDSASMCITETTPRVGKDSSKDELLASFALIDKRVDEVKGMVVNNEMRENKEKHIYDKYMTGYASPKGVYCDINLSLLPN
jgi:hypothetical protein